MLLLLRCLDKNISYSFWIVFKRALGSFESDFVVKGIDCSVIARVKVPSYRFFELMYLLWDLFNSIIK